MYATNMEYFGHLVNPDNFNQSLIRPEMFEIFINFEVYLIILKYLKVNHYLKNL
jgi:hypothetical protein